VVNCAADLKLTAQRHITQYRMKDTNWF